MASAPLLNGVFYFFFCWVRCMWFNLSFRWSSDAMLSERTWHTWPLSSMVPPTSRVAWSSALLDNEYSRAKSYRLWQCWHRLIDQNEECDISQIPSDLIFSLLIFLTVGFLSHSTLKVCQRCVFSVESLFCVRVVLIILRKVWISEIVACFQACFQSAVYKRGMQVILRHGNLFCYWSASSNSLVACLFLLSNLLFRVNSRKPFANGFHSDLMF